MTELNRLIDAIAATGLLPPEPHQLEVAINKDRPVRWSTNGKKHDVAGFCFVREIDGILVASFGCMRSGFREKWSSKSQNDMDSRQWEAHVKRREEFSKQLQEDAEFKASKAAITAQERWKNAKPAKDDSHQYLMAKNVDSYGLRVEGENLLIPVYNLSEKGVTSLQTISSNGEKRFLSCGKVQGGFYQIGDESDEVVICEGFATGASIHEATGLVTAIAFHAGNLLPVAKAIRDKFPNKKLIIAADDDWKKADNTGLEKAKEAASSIGAHLAIPQFLKNRGDKDTDFNDLARLSGANAVRLQIESAKLVYVLKDGVNLICGSTLNPVKIEWLWNGWLAKGKPTIMAGEPGTGKTTIAIHMAAIVTTGGRWPDDSTCPEGDVLIWSGEDDPSDTLMPRLIAAGANPSRVFFVGDNTIAGERRPFDPAKDVGLLMEEALKLPKLRLIVFDPIVNAVAGDSHVNTVVRRALQPLVDFASKIGASLIGITHFSKGGQGSDPTKRVMGSVAFTAVARVVMVAAKNKDKDGNERRVFARSKSNIGPDDGGFEYSIEQVEAIKGMWASRVVWGNALTGSATSLLAEHDGAEENSSDVVDLLREGLTTDSWTNVKELQQSLSLYGFSKKQIWSASNQLHVVRKRGGFQGAIYWRLPSGANLEISDLPVDQKTPPIDSKSPIDSIDSTFRKRESMEVNGINDDTSNDGLVDQGVSI
jgi:putative DNA primase/helicase